MLLNIIIMLLLIGLMITAEKLIQGKGNERLNWVFQQIEQWELRQDFMDFIDSMKAIYQLN